MADVTWTRNILTNSWAHDFITSPDVTAMINEQHFRDAMDQLLPTLSYRYKTDFTSKMTKMYQSELIMEDYDSFVRKRGVSPNVLFVPTTMKPYDEKIIAEKVRIIIGSVNKPTFALLESDAEELFPVPQNQAVARQSYGAYLTGV